MPFTKTWTGVTSDLQLATNWQAISVRNSAFRWQASGSGTSEYYLQTSGGGNPGLQAAPTSVYANGAALTSGTAGSLAASRWAYADNDSLGYSTIYIRLSDSTDPDTKAADFVTFYQIPKATEHVSIPVSGGTSISSNLDLSDVAIGDFRTADRWNGTIGSQSAYCRIDPDFFEWSGGTGYIDLGSAAISVTVNDTAKPATGYSALYLRGSALTVIDVRRGHVGLAALAGELLTATTLRVNGGVLMIGNGATITNLDIYAGTVDAYNSFTTVNCYGGTLTLLGAAAATTVNLPAGSSGKVVWNSSGTIGTLNQYSGTFDERQSGLDRTLTTMNYYGGSWLYNKEAVTHSAVNIQKSINISG